MIDQEDVKKNEEKWRRKLELLKLKKQAENPGNNMIDANGRKKTIDDFKDTQSYAMFKAMQDNAAKSRKGSRVFGGTKGKFD